MAQCEDYNKVDILMEGCSFTDENGDYRATAVTTLIRTKNHSIIVDPGNPRERVKILEHLKKWSVIPEDIDHVICTHGHVDHIGNINLFPHATYIVGHDICHKENIFEDDPFKKADKVVIETDQVEIVPTPGHTLGDISVVVHNTKHGIVVVAGDVFEFQNDEGCWEDNSECPEKQRQSRKQVMQLADWIIPGHGCMFKAE